MMPSKLVTRTDTSLETLRQLGGLNGMAGLSLSLKPSPIPGIIDKLIEVVRAGELDDQFAQASAERGLMLKKAE